MADPTTARVLVVDDEPELRELLADALGASDMRVLTAASGREAIDLAGRETPDLVITDISLGDASGLDVLDHLRSGGADIPAVVITGHRDAALLTEASRRRPVEVMIKPLDVLRLRDAVRGELARRARARRLDSRARRLRRLARSINHQRKQVEHRLDTTCADLTSAYRTLSGQLALQQAVINYQSALIAARNDDDVFRSLFRTLVRRSGGLFGVALVCDANAELQMVGRFGVPQPDSPNFCQALAKPAVADILSEPRCSLVDAGEQPELFDERVRRYLPGVSILAVPLLPTAGELIGLVVLYRKGEQPFTDEDVAFAELIATPTALAVRRTD